MGGIYALLVMKGLLMTLFYFLLGNQFRRNGLHPLLAFSIVGLLPFLFFRFDELRPQIFSFIGTLLVIQLTEYILACGRLGKPLKWYVLVSLPLLMLLWANLHRGFIIGIGVVMVYLVTEWISRKRGSTAWSDTAFRYFFIAATVSMVVAFFNPVGVTAVWASFTEVAGPFAQVIDEFFGTIGYFELYGMKYFGYLIVAIAVLPFAAMLFKWRKINTAHLFIAALFLIAGIQSFRFSLMMVAVVLSFASLYFSEALNRIFSYGKGLPILFTWCLAIGFLANSAFSRTGLTASPLETRAIPTAAVDYLERTNLEGNIYNFFEYGGYMSWRLYPQKIFIDQRNLSWDVYEEYSKAWRGDYANVFDKYKIGAVFYPVYERGTGKPSRLVVGLFNDPKWGVGYFDGKDVIFVKAENSSQLILLDKRLIVREIIQRMRKFK
jgi:hypothetical protein